MTPNPDDATVRQLLQARPTIAVVGLSPGKHRPSHTTAQDLQARGCRIVPVNPVVALQGGRILGEACHASVQQAAQALAREGLHIDVVNCFRKPEDIAPLADAAIAIGARCLWLQLGITHEEAAARARAAGLLVVQNRCLKIEYARLLGA